MSSAVLKNKIIEANLFTCDSIDGFIGCIKEELHYSGMSNSRFYVCAVDSMRFLTKLCFYTKSPPELYGQTSHMQHVDAEVNILSIFKEKILDGGVSPCILNLIYAKKCESMSQLIVGDACDKLLLSNDDRPETEIKQVMCRHLEAVKDGMAHDKCAFLALEICDITMFRYLRRHVNNAISVSIFKMLLFQVIYTLYAITKIYPKFRHLDLHTENVMLKFDHGFKFQSTNIKYMTFNIEGTKYYVPYVGIVVKLIDFGYSSLPEENIINNQTKDRTHMFNRSENDLILLFHGIYHTILESGSDKNNKIDAMLRKLEPNGTYVNYYTEHIRKITNKIPSYLEMATNPIFDEYKNCVPAESQIYANYSVKVAP
jgi:serine/threonine protein kinase